MALDIALIGRGSAANDGTGDSARDGALKLNKNTRLLEALAKGAVISATTTAQPASPSVGDLYILPTGKTGVSWGAMAIGALALFAEGNGVNEWFEVAPAEGWRIWARDTNAEYVHNGTAWEERFQNLPDELRTASGNPFEFPDGAKFTNAEFLGSDGSTQGAVGDTASAVNYFEMQGAAAGGGPVLAAVGAGTNIDANIAAKGTGGIYGGNGAGTLFAALDSGGVGVNYPAMRASITTEAVVWMPAGTDTNIPAVFGPKGTGFLSAQKPDSTTTGGNARGTRATDWQRSRSAATQVASGTDSTIVGGHNNTAGGQDSIAGGSGCTASGQVSVALGNSSQATAFGSIAIGSACLANASYAMATGQYALANGTGKRAHTGSVFGTDAGSCQESVQVLQASTTNATPTLATAAGGAISSGNTIPLQNNSTLLARIEVVARCPGSTEFAAYEGRMLISRGANAAATVLEWSTISALFEDDATWDVTLGVNTTQGCGTVTVTGASGKTIRWSVRVTAVEVAGG